MLLFLTRKFEVGVLVNEADLEDPKSDLSTFGIAVEVGLAPADEQLRIPVLLDSPVDLGAGFRYRRHFRKELERQKMKTSLLFGWRHEKSLKLEMSL